MLRKILASGLVFNVGESLIDNVFRDVVEEPVVGSVVYCDLAFGYAEHSGLYIGNDEIVHLNRKGKIEIVSSEEFILGTTAISIYVSCLENYPVGSDLAAARAIEMVGRNRNYNVILDNCHQFTSSCLSGDTENNDNFLWMLKDTASNELSVSHWRVWKR